MTKRTNEEIIKEIEGLMKELDLINSYNLTVSSYSFDINPFGDIYIHKELTSIERFINTSSERRLGGPGKVLHTDSQ